MPVGRLDAPKCAFIIERALTWTDTALEDLQWWADKEPRKLKRITRLCLASCRQPTTGIGKPEPLRYDYQGYWSRRIDHEQRLVYGFDQQSVTVIQCQYHYE